MNLTKFHRRKIVAWGLVGIGSIATLPSLIKKFFKTSEDSMNTDNSILSTFNLGFQWPTQEPFLFCVHHLDYYPAGNGELGVVQAAKAGREMGSDFTAKDGFRMYHGDDIPGFPVHPHRGFETITIVRKGYADHADSMGAAGRYGEGDVQWMTAGSGIQHSEMFPLLKTNESNTLELFQIWLNLPKKSKMVKPHFTMFWNEKIPRVKIDQDRVELTLIAGSVDFPEKLNALRPPPDSWAADPQSETFIALVKMKKGSTWEMPASEQSVHRTIYFFEGEQLKINQHTIAQSTGIFLNSKNRARIESLDDATQFLVLQSKPIGEPVVQHGPFVMNTQNEIIQTFQDYQRTQFGGWPWKRSDMIHGKTIERFAKYPDGKIEKPVS